MNPNERGELPALKPGTAKPKSLSQCPSKMSTAFWWDGPRSSNFLKSGITLVLDHNIKSDQVSAQLDILRSLLRRYRPVENAALAV